MKKIIYIMLLWTLPVISAAQPHYAQVLKDLESKNPTLLAAAKRAEAERVSVRSGLLLQDPEVEAAYYWGSPAEIGVRWDLSVSQSFEMPSVMVRKARLRNLQEHAADIDYRVVRNATMLETQLQCADLIYRRHLALVFNRRSLAAAQLYQLYQRRFELGDCSILEFNRVQMYLAEQQHLANDANMAEDLAIHDLCVLMNDDKYQLAQETYEPVALGKSFEDWYSSLEMNNPYLQQLSNEVDLHRQQERISRAQWLPEVAVGYASENVVGETFRGVRVGLTLPLWSQQRAGKAARLQADASQEMFNAQRAELLGKLRCMYHRHESLMRNVANLQSAFDHCNSIDLLTKALAGGEISLEDYLLQVDYYYDIELRLWEAAYELEQLHLHLNAIAL
ncbi:MAG: TolC family protein [Bacteroidales bacterium]|nr:TolC family protein [Bacteroidales bacterium]